MPFGVEWARASQFNWTFCNSGGTPFQDMISGLWSKVSFTVNGNTITIPDTVGGGKVYYMRGVWKTDALFAWGGFWVDPEAGKTNYYTGGSFANVGNETRVTLGTPLADGTEVQAYYVYNTGQKAVKYQAINSVPCMRPAWRSNTDYTYDFAVDRIFDAMAAVYFAYKEQGLDPSDILDFFWNSYIEHAASNGNPLVLDDFDRAFYDRGSYLLYADSTDGMDGFDHFGIELPPDDVALGRALRFKPEYYRGSTFSAWFGYGFNWDLTQEYFDTISKVKFKVRGPGAITRVQKFIKTAGAGTSIMILIDEFNLLQIRYLMLTVTVAGAPGTAELNLKVFGHDLTLLSDTNIRSATSTGPVNLAHGLSAYWEDGTLEVGDVWYVTGGNQEIQPHKLLVSVNDSETTDPDPFGEAHTFVHGVGDYYSEYQEFEVDFSQFWRLGNIIDCRDRKPGRWGNWTTHHLAVGTPYETCFYDVHDEETIEGNIYYTKQRVTWNMSSSLVALGFYVGVPADVDSTGRTSLNYLIKQNMGANVTFRTKVRDANGNYFYHDDVVGPNEWGRVTIPLVSLLPEVGGTLTHPLALVDIGIASGPLPQGAFEVVDLKFDEHLTFSGSNNLRIVEFKHQESSIELTEGPDWYLDDFGFDLSVEDPYPYVPRVAISLNAYGRNPWRGPTLVHYSHPLSPYLMNRFDIKNTELALHFDAQAEFTARYGGNPGPLLPVHTRNDIENIALCGEENFNKFCWWSRHRNRGKVAGAWRFNGVLTDSENSNTLSMSTGSAAYTTGICQPGNTALALQGTGQHAICAGTDFKLGAGDFTVEIVVKFNNTGGAGLVSMWDQTGNLRSWLLFRNTNNEIAFSFSTDGVNGITRTTETITDNDWHYIVASRIGGVLNLYIDGSKSSDRGAAYTFYDCACLLRIGATMGAWPGYLNGAVDYAAVHVGRGMEATEVSERWQIIQGELNGSDYPEVGYCLGQFWQFYRLAEYFFVSSDMGAWGILDNWLNWFGTYVVSEGSGYKFPIWFHEYGFNYDTESEFSFDAGGAASVVIGALYVYMRNGDPRALSLAQALLADLRLNRTSGDYGGYLYKSDYHYAWMNAIVAHAFGMAVVGRAGAAYAYPFSADDEAHFAAMMNNFWAMSGDTKPNLLNKEGIPYHDAEPHDIWDYAPHYLFMKEMGSMEGVVLMMHAAVDWGLYSGSWFWFNTLLEFMIRLGQGTISEQQIYSVHSNFMTSNVATKVNVSYGDYRRDNSLYAETKDQGMIDLLGEIRLGLGMHYGSPVITEDANTAAKIASRTLEYFSVPKESLQVVADLSAARLDLHDVVKLESKFHGIEGNKFYLIRRLYDPKKLRVNLELMRDVNYSPSWSVDADGTAYDSYAIDTNSVQDADWAYRAQAN